MSLWIVSAASSAVDPLRSVHARVSFSPAVKNVIRSSVSTSPRTTAPRADSPSRNDAASSSESSASSASSFRSVPSGPLTISMIGLTVSSSSSGGISTSPVSSLTAWRFSRCAASCSRFSTSARSFVSPDFACFATRSSRRCTWSRSAASSSSLSSSESLLASRVPDHPSSTARTRSTWRRLPSSSAPVPGTSTTRTAAGVTFFAPTVSASWRSRSSGTAAMPTLSRPVVSAPVSARKSDVLPAFGSPTIPTWSATSRS